MVPNLSSPGRSFKGAFAYHAHDKNTLDTDERIEWHSTRSLISDDLDTAERVMIATNYDAARLKEEAGIKATGRKGSKPVQTLSLAWHPDEKVDREEMERAADSAIKTLGLEDHQAVIIAHNDTEHQHVHVIINRVNPNDGRLASLSNSKRKLDQWAHEYEKDRGKIFTQKRAEKYDRKEKVKEHWSADQRREYAEKKRAESQTSERGILAQRQSKLRERHREEWKDLKARHRDQRQDDYQTYRQRLRQTKEQHSQIARENADKRRSEWRDLYREQREHKNNRDRMTYSVIGRFSLAVAAAKYEHEQGSTEGLSRLAWSNFISTKRREAVFEQAEERDKKALSEKQNFAKDKAFAHLKEQRLEEIERLRREQAFERDQLKLRQGRENAEIRQEWERLDEQVPQKDKEREGQDKAREEAVRDLRDSFYGEDDTRTRRLMREYGLEDAADLAKLDDERFAEFQERHADMIRSIGAEAYEDEQRQAKDRLEALRESRDDAAQERSELSAAKRMEKIRRAERDKEAEKKAREERQKRSRDRGGPEL